MTMSRAGKLGFTLIGSEEGDDRTGVFILALTDDKPREAGLKVFSMLLHWWVSSIIPVTILCDCVGFRLVTISSKWVTKTWQTPTQRCLCKQSSTF